MKSTALIFILFVGLISMGCKKSTSGTTHRGVVFVNICGQIGVQSLGPDYVGQDTWQDGAVMHMHVFTVQNSCQVGGEVSQGDTIKFKIIGTQVQNCMQCMMYVHVPDTAYAIQIVN